MAWFVIIGTIPGGIVGFLCEKKIDQLFHQPGAPVSNIAMVVMGFIIAILGLALYLADKYTGHTKKMNQINLKDAILIGLSQAFAIFPGVSRSGSTITSGLALGLKREAAARFSFYLSAPIILGAGLNSILEIVKMKNTGAIGPNEWVLFPIGVVAAAVSGFLCIRWLLSFLQKHSVKPFVYYRWALAILIIVVAVIR
jgi:undecaprenyl-diphosphatase